MAPLLISHHSIVCMISNRDWDCKQLVENCKANLRTNKEKFIGEKIVSYFTTNVDAQCKSFRLSGA
jgi:hypothetical protein